MCGIAGWLGNKRHRVSDMLAALRHRGPDATGMVDLPEHRTTLGHARLSILDLDHRSDQPFASPCGRYLLTYNGEIYNYETLRERLAARGIEFRTTSDTEVLLWWLIVHGSAGLADLEGMFAFCWVDRAAGEALLARDPIGEKPLYYSAPGRDDLAFAFSSELKGLLAGGACDTSLDEHALADYLRFLYTPAPRTLYRGARELPPGHAIELSLGSGEFRVWRYFNLESAVAEYAAASNEGEAVDAFRQRFHESVRMRLRSDAPLGVFLSGGLDSNAILAAAHRLERREPIDAYTVRFEQPLDAAGGDESQLAADAARRAGARHHVTRFDTDAAPRDALERVVALFDAPFGNATALVADSIARLAAADCKVCLAGDGGDEILAGYPRHRALLHHRRWSRLPGPVRRSLAALARLAPETGRRATQARRVKQFLAGLNAPIERSFLEWSTYLNEAELSQALGRPAESEFAESLVALFAAHRDDPLRAAALVDLRSFVPYNLMQSADRTGMAHSLETRCPFLAPPLIYAALAAPEWRKARRGRVKPLLVDALGSAIPASIRQQPKRPFNPPLAAYVRRHEAELGDLLLHGSAASLLRPGFVARQWRLFTTGQRDNSTLLWGLAALEHWLGRAAAVGSPRAAA